MLETSTHRIGDGHNASLNKIDEKGPKPTATAFSISNCPRPPIVDNLHSQNNVSNGFAPRPTTTLAFPIATYPV